MLIAVACVELDPASVGELPHSSWQGSRGSIDTPPSPGIPVPQRTIDFEVHFVQSSHVCGRCKNLPLTFPSLLTLWQDVFGYVPNILI